MKVEIVKGNYKKNYKSLKLKVAAYVRVSTELDSQISSFESQRKYYYSKIYRNSNWEFVGIYDDYGISARSVKNRIGFNAMIQDALDGKIDLILTKSISRFARNTVDSIEYVRLLKKHNVGVLFEEENIYTLDMQSELLLTILSSVAQQESNNISNRVRVGIEMNFTNGKLRGQMVVYGYYYKNKKMKIRKKEAKVIKEIFGLYASGTSVSKICSLLNDNKVKPPFNKKWIPDYVYIILRNEKYIGKFKYGKVYQHEDLRIVSNEIFDIVKNKMKENRNFLKSDVDIISGIIRCGFCGRIQSFCSNTNLYSTASCRINGCKNGLNIGLNNLNRILLEFQNELLENYDDVFNYKTSSNDRINSNNEKKYYDRALFEVDQKLNNKINKYDLINKLKVLNDEHIKELDNINTKKINDIKLKSILTNLKERFLNIDSFPADEVSKELVTKLVKYIQFGETLKYNYKNRFNCRIVLKVDENYNPLVFRFKADYKDLCKNESYIVLWKFSSVYYYMRKKKYIKVKIVIDKKDIEV